MPFCSNCGKQLADGAKFCFECGTPTNNDNTKRKSVYDGEIHKCPNCGETLNSFVAKCPSCGYELRDAKVASSVQEFTFRLSQTQSQEQQIILIRNFPIPNTKEDIFEFIILASTNITNECQKDVFDAWLAKFNQSYQKAKLVFGSDVDFTKFQSIYDKTNKQISKEKLYRNVKAAGNTISKSSSLIRKIFLLIAKNAAVVAGIILLIVAINVDHSGGNSAMHELIGVILLIVSAIILPIRKASYMEILIGAGSGVLTFYLAKYLENGSMLQLGGIIVLIIVTISFFKKLSKKEEN